MFAPLVWPIAPRSSSNTRCVDVERFAAGDARELDRAEDVAIIIVVADHAAFTNDGTIDCKVGATLD